MSTSLKKKWWSEPRDIVATNGNGLHKKMNWHFSHRYPYFRRHWKWILIKKFESKLETKHLLDSVVCEYPTTLTTKCRTKKPNMSVGVLNFSVEGCTHIACCWCWLLHIHHVLLFCSSTSQQCFSFTPIQQQSPATSQPAVFFSHTTPTAASSTSTANRVTIC